MIWELNSLEDMHLNTFAAKVLSAQNNCPTYKSLLDDFELIYREKVTLQRLLRVLKTHNLFMDFMFTKLFKRVCVCVCV